MQTRNKRKLQIIWIISLKNTKMSENNQQTKFLCSIKTTSCFGNHNATLILKHFHLFLITIEQHILQVIHLYVVSKFSTTKVIEESVSTSIPALILF